MQHTHDFLRALGLSALGMMAGCNSGSGGGVAELQGIPDALERKPQDGALYFVDTHRGGEGARLRVRDMAWGRLVDVHQIDPITGAVVSEPVFRDMLVSENIQTDGINYELETNPVTQTTRLIILRSEADPEFEQLALNASTNLPPVFPAPDDGSTGAPVSFVARNSALVMRFDDLLDDSFTAASRLVETVQVRAGYPPNQPFGARTLFDPNHGGIGEDGLFHSSRLIIDFTVSEPELGGPGVPVELNALGLPASVMGFSGPNLSIRIPTRVVVEVGQFRILTSLGGSSVTDRDNGPIDTTSATRDLVRGFRAGNGTDTNNGFMLDLNQPQIVGSWPADVSLVRDDPNGEAGFDFLATFAFSTPCQRRPEPGSILSTPRGLLESTGFGGEPEPGTGEVRDLPVRLISDDPALPTDFLGTANFQSTLDPDLLVPGACWLEFAPRPGAFPTSDVEPGSQIVLRVSEPTDPDSVLPFDTFQVIQGSAEMPPTATTIVPGRVQSSVDLRNHLFSPALPLNHEQGTPEVYHIRVASGENGIIDLAGNGLKNGLAPVQFVLDPDAATERSRGIVLRFEELDEYQEGDANGKNDLRGQFFYNLENGSVGPRPVSRFSAPVDRNNPVPGIMIPFAPGVQTPLSPLGSRLHAVWRYCDAGWLVDDESKYNVDIEGLSWSPVSQSVISDFFERFEMRLAHAAHLPDEYVSQGLQSPSSPSSGLIESPMPFSDNILDDDLAPQVIIHERNLGYAINPVDTFATAGGTTMMPFPWNRVGGPQSTFTWRDTAALSVGGLAGAGIPMEVETGPPLMIYGDNLAAGDLADAGEVPTIGLPLLIEVRCYPSNTGLGLNALDINLAINSSVRPNFRSYSTGGIDQSGMQVRKDPDLELVPTGGFNPSSSPTGLPTTFTADNALYIGQLDIVIRLSRIHTIWFDTETGPDFSDPVVEQIVPQGAQLLIDYRGARGFNTAGFQRAFDAEQLDPYGDPERGIVQFFRGVNRWRSTIGELDGARYIQVRFTFVNNIDTGLNATLAGFGMPFRDP